MLSLSPTISNGLRDTHNAIPNGTPVAQVGIAPTVHNCMGFTVPVVDFYRNALLKFNGESFCRER